MTTKEWQVHWEIRQRACMNPFGDVQCMNGNFDVFAAKAAKLQGKMAKHEAAGREGGPAWCRLSAELATLPEREALAREGYASHQWIAAESVRVRAEQAPKPHPLRPGRDVWGRRLPALA